MVDIQNELEDNGTIGLNCMQEDYVLDYKLKCHALFWYFFLFSFDLFYSILSAKVQPFCEQNWTLYRKWVELLKYFDLTKLILSAILTLRTNEMVTCCSFFSFPHTIIPKEEKLFCFVMNQQKCQNHRFFIDFADAMCHVQNILVLGMQD